MMKEIQQIISAYDRAEKLEKKTALATVVKVDGSAYRRPGARMLVTEDGELTGAISGGCLEGDALRKAQAVIFQQKSIIVTYDTTDEDDQKFGVGLGCNGIIEVLIEPIDSGIETNPIALLKSAVKERKSNILLTIFNLDEPKSQQIGTCLLAKSDSHMSNSNRIPDFLLNQVQNEFSYSVANRFNKLIEIPESPGSFAFLEWLHPTLNLILFGAGNDTIPLVEMSAVLGWEVTLIDGRKNLATINRFPKAKQIIVGSPQEVLKNVAFDDFTVVLLMTHNFEYEAEILAQIFGKEIPYIGILGPKKKTLKLVDRMKSKGLEADAADYHAPIGLDIGAEGPEEIALSILSEIKAVMSGKPALSLKDRKGPIHANENQNV